MFLCESMIKKITLYTKTVSPGFVASKSDDTYSACSSVKEIDDHFFPYVIGDMFIVVGII